MALTVDIKDDLRDHHVPKAKVVMDIILDFISFNFLCFDLTDCI